MGRNHWFFLMLLFLAILWGIFTNSLKANLLFLSSFVFCFCLLFFLFSSLYLSRDNGDIAWTIKQLNRIKRFSLQFSQRRKGEKARARSHILIYREEGAASGNRSAHLKI